MFTYRQTRYSHMARKDLQIYQESSVQLRLLASPTSALGRITRGSHITYYSLMFFIAYAFKGQVHVFAGLVEIVSNSFCRTSAFLKYFCPLCHIVGNYMSQLNYVQ